MREILIVSANVPKEHAGSHQPWLVFRNQGAHRIATFMRSMGRDVEVIDNAQWFDQQQAKKLLDSRLGSGSKLLAFSVAFWFGKKEMARQWAAYARSIAPGIKIAVCGPKMGTALDMISDADYIISGYAEALIPDLLHHLEGIDGLKAQQLPSGTLAIQSQVHYPTTTLPELITRLEKRDFVEPHETLFLETSRGCVFKCAFCDYHLLGKKKGDYIRPREAMLEQIAEHARWGVKSFILSDETSNELDDKLRDLAWASESSGIDPKFSAFVRADLLASRPHQLDIMAQAGLMRWHCGLESFNEASAKAIGKGAMVGRKVADFLESTKQRFGDEVSINASIIVGLPYDTVDDVREAADWVSQSSVISSATYFRLWLYDKHNDPMGLLSTDGLSLLAGDPARYGYDRLESSLIPLAYQQNISPSEFLWRSKVGLTIYQASDLADELNLSFNSGIKQWRDYSMWGRCAAAGLGIPALDRHDLVVDQQQILMLHERRIQRYIRNKLAWSDFNVS